MIRPNLVRELLHLLLEVIVSNIVSPKDRKVSYGTWSFLPFLPLFILYGMVICQYWQDMLPNTTNHPLDPLYQAVATSQCWAPGRVNCTNLIIKSHSSGTSQLRNFTGKHCHTILQSVNIMNSSRAWQKLFLIVLIVLVRYREGMDLLNCFRS